jgi:hypothetical protein
VGPMRARRSVALAVFEPSFHVEFVDVDQSVELRPRRVQRPQEALEAPTHTFV